MNHIRTLISTIFRLKYSMAVSAFICSTVLTVLQLRQLPGVGGPTFLTCCWFWCRYLPGFAAMGLFGGLCALLVLKWKAKSKLTALAAAFFVPFVFYATPEHVWAGVWSILQQMTKSPLDTWPFFAKYLVFEYLWIYCLPGFIGGVMVVFFEKAKQTESVSLLGRTDDGMTIPTESKVSSQNLNNSYWK